MSLRGLRRIGWCLLVMLCWGRADAHPGTLTSAVAKVRPGGTFELRLHFDLLAYALEAPPNHGGEGPQNALLDGPPADLDTQLADAKARFQQAFGVKGGTVDSLTFPTAREVQASVRGLRMRLPVMADALVTGHLSPGNRTIAFRFDEVLGSVVLTTEFPYQEPVSEPVEAGAWSQEQTIPARTDAPAPSPSPVPALNLTPPAASPVPVAKGKLTTPAAPATPATPSLVAKATPAPAQTILALPLPKPPPQKSENPLRPLPTPPPLAAPDKATPVLSAPPPAPVSEAVTPPATGWATHFAAYVRMGYTHILPEGTDHILFILGLFLLSTRLKPLLQQVTAFTVAHSLTLALSLYGVVHLPPVIVEPVIAASIVFVAVENLVTKEMTPWRPLLVFGFGLIHGLGFASALQEAGLRQGSLLPALIGFNVGVELGQLTIVLAAFLLVRRFRNHPGYRKWVIIPGSCAIAAVALFWTVQRL